MARKTELSSRCPEARRLLPDYVAGELTAVQARGLSAHLAGCAACRQEEVGYRRALGALSAPREPQRPGDLYPAFRARLAAADSRRRATAPLRWATAAACILLLGIAGAATVSHLARTSAVQPPQDVAIRPQPAPMPTAIQPRKEQQTASGPSTPSAPVVKPDDAPLPDDGVGASPGPDQAQKPPTMVAERGGSRDRSVDEPGPRPVRRPRMRHSPSLRSIDGVPVVIVRRSPDDVMGARWPAPVPTGPGPVESAGGYAGSPDGPTAPVATAARPGDVRAPSGAVMVPRSDEHVQIGGNWTRIRTATGVDRRGRPLVNVIIDNASPAAEGAAGPTELPSRGRRSEGATR